MPGCFLAAYVIEGNYQATYKQTISDAQTLINSNTNLQLDIYSRDEQRLLTILSDFTLLQAISLAAVYDSQGERLVMRDKNGPSTEDLQPLEAVRADASTVDTVAGAFDAGGAAADAGFWSSLSNSAAPIHFTAAVFSSLNPARRGLTREDFIVSMLQPPSNGSRVVIGYVHARIDRQQLRDAAFTDTGLLLSLYLLVVVLGAAAIFLMLRRATAPLIELICVAREIVIGEQKEKVIIEHGEAYDDIVTVFNNVIDGMTHYQSDIEVRHKLLSIKVDESASQLSQREEELSRATEEISDSKERLHKLAYYDRVTELPNMALFTEQLRVLLQKSERGAGPVVLLSLNLKHFNRINDSMGRRAGDALLVEVARRLTTCLPTHNAGEGPGIDVARLGNDEFSIVLSRLDKPSSAGPVALQLIDALSKPAVIEGQEVVVAPSIGIAVAPDDGSDVEALLRAAVTAMHVAKKSPKGEFVFYRADMDAGDLDEIKLEAELRRAIARDQLLLHYQPQVDTGDGSIRGAEALLRWEHPEYGQVPPFRFIPLAESIGLMDELGAWVLVEACRQMKAFQAEGLELPRMAINVSRLQFGLSFTNRVKEVLQQANLDPSVLELGLSEEILMDNDSDTIRSLRELSDMGVYLSIDNFGTTAAPLSYLSQYPLNELKIDRSFVTDCDTRESNAQLVKAIIAIAKSLELSIVAEGVETQGEYQFLANHGARIMQGYLFSKPVPVDKLIPLLQVPWTYMTQIQRLAMINERSDIEA